MILCILDSVHLALLCVTIASAARATTRVNSSSDINGFNVQKGFASGSLRRLDEEPRQSIREREVASSPTVAQQRRRVHGPAIRIVVAYMPRSQQAVWSCLGQATPLAAPNTTWQRSTMACGVLGWLVIFISSWCCEGLSRSAGAGGSGMMKSVCRAMIY
jgi:hypothetical protein